MPTIAFHTLGCKLNFSETATLSRLFVEKNYQKVSFNQVADTYVINTCSVTELADKKCKQAIRKAIRQNPESTVIVTGCFAQLKPQEIVNIPGVSLVLGANEKLNLSKYLEHIQQKKSPESHSCEIDSVENYFGAFSLNERTRSFLKVQDGCDYPCTYCTIPKARGKSRNESIADLVSKAEVIAQNGIKEIILTGVNIGDFGKSTSETFFDLIKALDQVEGIDRIRISSIEPNLLTDEMLLYISQSQRIMPHFHIPLQSGSDEVLSDMKRRYNTKMFREKIERINALVPHAGIGVDVIVGFPTETDELFEEALNFINSLNIMALHVFTYSDREGTVATAMEKSVPFSNRQHRSKILHQLSEKKQRYFNEQFIGQTRPVLTETYRNRATMYGFTDNYIRVEVPYDKRYKNKIVQVRLESTLENGNMKGRIIE
ncbi:MAG: tRNA (N(6)-L-threonylcarbamoyladenosine(37)-C(2))-methylthiotransferase MtaB [Bacteroidales bacterium]|nr:tRNA (N(6)-L-threonylcarbamoyladenosine(37)-C(2))-methylthiotransferase MtaB [Bacteroidales bacterium]